MKLPLGFDQEKKEKKVCKLRKYLYGQKQSPHAWFERFTKAIMIHGYTQAQSDHTLFYHHNDGKVTILIVYMDDIRATRNDPMRME